MAEERAELTLERKKGLRSQWLRMLTLARPLPEAGSAYARDQKRSPAACGRLSWLSLLFPSPIWSYPPGWCELGNLGSIYKI